MTDETPPPPPPPRGNPEARLRDLIRRDRRFPVDAYLFLYEALGHTQSRLGRNGHVTGKELLDGIRQLALDQFGRMAGVVFEGWNIRRTEDFGEIVFTLVENDLLGKTETDTRADFAGGYDFTAAFEESYRIPVPPPEAPRPPDDS